MSELFLNPGPNLLPPYSVCFAEGTFTRRSNGLRISFLQCQVLRRAKSFQAAGLGLPGTLALASSGILIWRNFWHVRPPLAVTGFASDVVDHMATDAVLYMASALCPLPADFVGPMVRKVHAGAGRADAFDRIVCYLTMALGTPGVARHSALAVRLQPVLLDTVL